MELHSYSSPHYDGRDCLLTHVSQTYGLLENSTRNSCQFFGTQRTQQFIHAAEAGHLDDVLRILNSGIDVHANSDQALINAAKKGYLYIVAQLLEAGANVHAQNEMALQLSSQNSHLAVVKLLLYMGADPHELDLSQITDPDILEELK